MNYFIHQRTREWKRDELAFFLGIEKAKAISKIPILKIGSEDVSACSKATDGSYTVADGYRLLA